MVEANIRKQNGILLSFYGDSFIIVVQNMIGANLPQCQGTVFLLPWQCCPFFFFTLLSTAFSRRFSGRISEGDMFLHRIRWIWTQRGRNTLWSRRSVILCTTSPSWWCTTSPTAITPSMCARLRTTLESTQISSPLTEQVGPDVVANCRWQESHNCLCFSSTKSRNLCLATYMCYSFEIVLIWISALICFECTSSFCKCLPASVLSVHLCLSCVCPSVRLFACCWHMFKVGHVSLPVRHHCLLQSSLASSQHGNFLPPAIIHIAD